MSKNYFEILAEWGITNPTEEDVWEAIQEAHPDKEIYSDGDLTEWLQFDKCQGVVLYYSLTDKQQRQKEKKALWLIFTDKPAQTILR